MASTNGRPVRDDRGRYATWFALAWIVGGLVLGLVMLRTRPKALAAAGRISVPDDTVPVGAD